MSALTTELRVLADVLIAKVRKRASTPHLRVLVFAYAARRALEDVAPSERTDVLNEAIWHLVTGMGTVVR